MSPADVWALTTLGVFAFFLTIMAVWNAGRDQGRRDVLDHGWRRKDR